MDPEAAYYQAVEEHFVSLRGDPLFLSNADWLWVRKWRTEGIPLRIVLRGVRDALDGHAHSWGRSRKVRSLGYCAQAVEVARDRWQRALGAGAETPDTTGALQTLATSLEAATGLGPRSRDRLTTLARTLRERLADPGRLSDLEPWLQSQEAGLLEELKDELGGEGVQAILEAVDRDLAPYRDRMPAKVLGSIRSESVARRILEAHGLPRLSLFHLTQ